MNITKSMNKAQLVLIYLFVSTIALHAGQARDKKFTVGPGDNKSHAIALHADRGDTLDVSFAPQIGHEFTADTECGNPAQLNWLRTSDHSFKLLIPETVLPNSTHKTEFTGMIKKSQIKNEGGSAIVEDPNAVPWNLEGTFDVLDAHQAVEFDFNRKKPAQMETLKPNEGKDPIYEVGKVTWDPNKDTRGGFVGTMGDGGYMGVYRGDLVFGNGAANPLKLVDEANGPQPCPEKDNATVHYAYYGCNDSGKANSLDEYFVKVDPDTITLQTYDPQAELRELEAMKATLNQSLDAANKIVAQLTIDLDDAKAALSSKQKELEEWIQRKLNIALKNAQNNVQTAEKLLNRKIAERDATKALVEKIKAALNRIDELNQLIENIDAQINKLKEALKSASTDKKRIIRAQIDALQDQLKAFKGERGDLKALASQQKLASALRSLERSETSAVNAEAALLAAKELLNTATARVMALIVKMPEYIAMNAEIATLKAKVVDLEAKLVAAQNEAKKITEDLRLLGFDIALIKLRLEEWETLYLVSLKKHEEEHRHNAYFFANKLNGQLNHLRVWAYAPIKSDAEMLGRKHLKSVVTDIGNQHAKQLFDIQKLFDYVTVHGKYPNRWKRDDMLK